MVMLPIRLPAPAVGVWQIDSDASRVEFSVDERMALVKRRTVTGRFSDVTGTIVLYAKQPDYSCVEITIDVATLDTGEPRREKNLRGRQFFDAERFSAITFTSRWSDTVDAATGRYRTTGYLTVRDVTREVEVEVGCDRSGPVVRIDATATLNRRDFGMTWGNAFLWIDDEVRIHASVEAVCLPVARAA